MARKVFFSFHYDRDVWRSSIVRNCNVIVDQYTKNDYVDSVDWEKIKRGGEDNIKRWIDNQLNGTSVTVVLIGNQTSERKFVNYEIDQSYKRGNGLLGIYIHNIKNQYGQTDFIGTNPLSNWYIKDGYTIKYFSDMYPTYDWVLNNGRLNISNWIEQAAKIAGR